MSIIHDALKKVQQSLSSKAGEIPVEPLPNKDPKDSTYLYATPPPVENLQQPLQDLAPQKPPVFNKFKSLLALICAIAITVGSALYLFHQFKNNIPKVQRFAKKSFYQMIHKKEVPEFKTKAPEDLKPLAQLTINPPVMNASNPAAKPPAAVTLNIHGIMSNATGNLVLINDQVYQEGDEVDGAKIVKIDLNSITIINNGVEQTISVRN